MRSSSGEHYVALDHVRAMAAFMVFTWHFIHGRGGQPIPLSYVPAFPPASLLDEGHTGVALFMTLSGYLFAKLPEGKTINYKAFFWNRALRLLPLLLLVLLIVGVTTPSSGRLAYAADVGGGILFPTIPNGGWSITVEFHFYLVLPLLLWMLRKSKLLLILMVVASIAMRCWLYGDAGEIQSLAYWTIIGRIDQFVWGILLYYYRGLLARRHVLAGATLVGFSLFYWHFDRQGGFYQNPFYPSPSQIWIFIPTIEGFAYAVAIAWYDTSFTPANTGISRLIGRLGTYSYSIYLLHIFFVFRAAAFVHQHVVDLSNFYVACAFSAVCFLMMMPIGYLSFRFVEAPCLRLRKPYFTHPNTIRETTHQAVEQPTLSTSQPLVIDLQES